jgi:hypothetical protein
MVTVRPWAEFRSSLPEDVIEEGGHIIQFGGKSVAEAIAGIFKGFGCEVSAPDYLGELGWEFSITAKRRQLSCRLTLIDDYLLVMEDDHSTVFEQIFRRGSPHPVYFVALKRLAQEMAGDPRFQDVRWYAKDEVQSGLPGTPTPVIEG